MLPHLHHREGVREQLHRAVEDLPQGQGLRVRRLSGAIGS
jgi:hypothetical protein